MRGCPPWTARLASMVMVGRRTQYFAVRNIGASAFAHPTSALFVLLPARNALLLKIELALDLAAGLVVDLALAQQAIDVVTLGGDQVEPQMRAESGGVEAFIDRARKLMTARLVPR